MKIDPALFKLNEFELRDLLYLGRKAVKIRKKNKYPYITLEGKVLTITFRFTSQGGFHVDKLERNNG